jgi:spore coat polysaccharide biosynthesis protein SpsF
MIRDEATRLGVFCPYIDVPENDVLARYLEAAKVDDSDVIVRITGDCPLVDAEVVDMTIEALADRDLASNVVTRTFPVGLDVEVMPVDTLERLDRYLSKHDPLREHVCAYAYGSDRFTKVSVTDGVDNSDIRWCVDTYEDFEDVREVLKWGVMPYEEAVERWRKMH